MRSKIARQIEKSLAKLCKSHQKIATKIEANWGTDTLNSYFAILLLKDRNTRTGLAFDSYIAVLELYIIHLSEYGDFSHPLNLSNLNFNIETIEANEWQF